MIDLFQQSLVRRLLRVQLHAPQRLLVRFGEPARLLLQQQGQLITPGCGLRSQLQARV